jgi:UDP-N-acetylmuramoyl-tripeptide--D-alanyl-D-alanine ligase
MTTNLYQLYQKYPEIVTDSRKITKDCLFFALKGETFDGNRFAQTAIEAGAAYAIVDDPNLPPQERLYVVTDVLTALQDLARHHRRQFDIPILVITGSNGKTTTKELVSNVLAAHYRTHFTKGNLNNHIGVPLTLLAMPADTEVAVIETGANHVGEIDFLCRIAEPTHGLITNVGKAHLEGFGSFEGVKQTKSELYRYLSAHRGTIFLNQDELFLKDLIPAGTRTLTYGKSEKPNVNTPYIETVLKSVHPFLAVAFLSDKGRLMTVKTQLVGVYNFNNIQTAIAVGRYFKVPTAKIKAAMESYVSSNNRSQIVKRGDATILLDAYNANPSSMRGALQNLSEMPFKTKIAILGDMRELGADSLVEHEVILKLAQSFDFQKVITVGSEFGKVHTALDAHFETTLAVKNWFQKMKLDTTTCVLIKGSRGMKLETILL